MENELSGPRLQQQVDQSHETNLSLDQGKMSVSLRQMRLDQLTPSYQPTRKMESLSVLQNSQLSIARPMHSEKKELRIRTTNVWHTKHQSLQQLQSQYHQKQLKHRQDLRKLSLLSQPSSSDSSRYSL